MLTYEIITVICFLFQLIQEKTPAENESEYYNVSPIQESKFAVLEPKFNNGYQLFKCKPRVFSIYLFLVFLILRNL